MLKLFKDKKYKKLLFPGLISLAILLGFFVRLYFAPGFIKESGDLRLFADWGQKFWEYGPKNFYTYKLWYYAPPNYPPLLSLIYAGAFWLYDHKYFLAQLHNAIRIPPATFIIYFYKYGYYLLLKLPGILADLGLGILIYKIVFEITQNRTKSLIGMILYLFNPVTVFLSGVWGQTDSLVTFFGLLAFFLLVRKKALISLPLFFLSLYTKPNWSFFIPFYIFLLFLVKPKARDLLAGAVLCTLIFFVSTNVFAQGNVFEFTKWLFISRILPTANATHKASVGAFNFYSLFFKLDYTLDTTRILNAIPLYIFGYLAFSTINLLTFFSVLRKKVSLLSVVAGLFTVGFGGYLFLTDMLERYFFQSFVPMIVLMVVDSRLLLGSVGVNLAVFANIYYSFFRRSRDGVANFFTENSYFVIKVLSLVNLFSFIRLSSPFLLQFRRGASRRASHAHGRD